MTNCLFYLWSKSETFLHCHSDTNGNGADQQTAVTIKKPDQQNTYSASCTAKALPRATPPLSTPTPPPLFVQHCSQHDLLISKLLSIDYQVNTLGIIPLSKFRCKWSCCAALIFFPLMLGTLSYTTLFCGEEVVMVIDQLPGRAHACPWGHTSFYLSGRNMSCWYLLSRSILTCSCLVIAHNY